MATLLKHLYSPLSREVGESLRALGPPNSYEAWVGSHTPVGLQRLICTDLTIADMTIAPTFCSSARNSDMKAISLVGSKSTQLIASQNGPECGGGGYTRGGNNRGQD